MNEFVKTEISPDGVRYKKRPTGSPFDPSNGGTLSCYMCGQHQLRRLGANRWLCGIKMFSGVDCCLQAMD